MENEIKLTIIATGFPTTETLIQRDVAKTMAAANRMDANADSLDIPPFLRRVHVGTVTQENGYPRANLDG
jgi:hypothetical protein